ncbi:MAG: peptidyl-prolyl cis-trans isomerase, EpsD family [Burkholderiales bacterium]|nr:peptidyl-prolyl cis-trans isomerase, EpsD family [Burkholderiales bacterium]
MPTRAACRPAGAWRAAGCAGIALAVLAGCGRDAGTRSASQVLARVDGTEITVSQVNNELARLGGNAEHSPALVRRILEGLVDQQLLVDQAVEARLDRDPQIVQALERTKRQVLADAYLERLAGTSRPSAAQIKAFYQANPGLFEKRRVYGLREWTIGPDRMSPALLARLDKARSAAEVVLALKEMKIEYREAQTTRPAEQLPIEMLPKITSAGRGAVLVVNAAAQANIMQIVDWSEQPVGELQAAELIERYLANARKKDVADRRLKELRASAKIEFRDGGAVAKPAPAESRPAAPADESTQKGLKGLLGR